MNKTKLIIPHDLKDKPLEIQMAYWRGRVEQAIEDKKGWEDYYSKITGNADVGNSLGGEIL